jgi:lipopolysaccharide transport system permease protein
MIRNESIAQPAAPHAAASQPNLKSRPQRTSVVLEPNRSWNPISLREIWSHRELLYFLIWRDLKVRYKQTILGLLWVILQPVMMTAIFTVFLGQVVRVPSGPVPYVLLAYTGLVTWMFFSSSVLQSGSSLVGNTSLVTKIYFPRAIIPMAAVGGRLVDFAVSLVILIGTMLYYGIAPTKNVLMLPVCLVLLCLFAFGVGLFFAAANVRYRDVAIALPVAIQLWMFVSPVVYPTSLVPERWQWLYQLNPMTGIIDGVRSSTLNVPFAWTGLGISTLIILIVLVYSIFAFKRMESCFADIV